MPTEQWFFVRHLVPGEVESSTSTYEVQILNDMGQAVSSWFFDQDCKPPKPEGGLIPAEVLATAKRFPMGFGAYLDQKGQMLDMGRNPADIQIPTEPEEIALAIYEVANRLLTMASPNREAALIRLRAVVRYFESTAVAEKAARLLQQLGD